MSSGDEISKFSVIAEKMTEEIVSISPFTSYTRSEIKKLIEAHATRMGYCVECEGVMKVLRVIQQLLCLGIKTI